MPTDPSFRMTIEDIFSIRGRGTVVTGRIESGTLKTGDELYILGQNSSRKTTVTGIESFRKMLTQAQSGDNVGVLLRDIDKSDVQHGDILAASPSGG